VDFKQIPAVLPDDSVSGPHPTEVGGHIGVGLLSRFRVIFDYTHGRIYMIPAAPSLAKAPFTKDRSGLVLRKIHDDYIVTFVCPGSPAIKAGFQPGDTVTQVNNQPLPALQGIAWQTAAWSSVQATEVGKTYSFTLKDGTVRTLTTAEFF
jgi:membrane-associated protease RseP (regulator of RpoE activity)